MPRQKVALPRRSISMKGQTYAAFKTRCERDGIKMSTQLEKLILAHLRQQPREVIFKVYGGSP